MLIGYARVSTQEQDTQAQISALKSAGCELIFQEKASGGRWDRPELQRLLQQLRKDDQVIVWKLDRLSRSLKDLLLTLEKIENTGADFRSITENIDTSTPAGRMMMQIVGSFADLNAPCFVSGQRAGLRRHARMAGLVGRRPKLTPQQQKEIVSLVHIGAKNGRDAARLFRVHPSTVVRLLARHRMTEIGQT
ncbi:recombinase family protein [Klebsiella pneumoniae]|uniref:recombinase family protein n=1 Tax=Klebsiella pneumoniae TaxID=573 RepID=UPI000DFB8992|nr:recombinase family protein [Klebsiella pneumoniae]STS93876.1 DNA-invertase [Klebsiella pneumoniae]